MQVKKNQLVCRAPGLVRLQVSASGKWAVADNDMNTGYVWRYGDPEFRPVVQAVWLNRPQFPGAVYYATRASRCYMGSVVDLPDGGCIACWKLGVKEVEASGVPFTQCEWGVYMVRFDADGKVLGHGRYAIHKGNAQIVGSSKADEYQLIASTGLCWKLKADGAVTQKTKVVMGESGEKNFATAYATSFVGYTGHPSAVARMGIDQKAIPVLSKPPFDTGDDMLRCAHIAPFKRPKGLWWAMVIDGQIRMNYVGPKMTEARWPMTSPPSGGQADKEARHVPALFQIPGNAKSVGIAVKNDGSVWVQVLNEPTSRIRLGPGAWSAAAQSTLDSTSIFYFNGGQMFEAVITHD